MSKRHNHSSIGGDKRGYVGALIAHVVGPGIGVACSHLVSQSSGFWKCRNEIMARYLVIHSQNARLQMTQGPKQVGSKQYHIYIYIHKIVPYILDRWIDG